MQQMIGSAGHVLAREQMAHAGTLLRKLDPHDRFTVDEKHALLDAPFQLANVEPGYAIVREGDRPTRSCLVVNGFVCASKLTGEGDRQITSFYISGDIPDLQSLHLGTMDITFQTLTSATLAFIPHTAIAKICQDFPRLNNALWHSTLVDAAIYRDWISNVGQRDAIARTSHLLCEMIQRMNVVGMVERSKCEFPMSQGELGDALGLSVVHVNRTLQKLRKLGLIELKNKRLDVLDWDRLATLGDFDPTYLHGPPWADRLGQRQPERGESVSR